MTKHLSCRHTDIQQMQACSTANWAGCLAPQVRASTPVAGACIPSPAVQARRLLCLPTAGQCCACLQLPACAGCAAVPALAPALCCSPQQRPVCGSALRPGSNQSSNSSRKLLRSLACFNSTGIPQVAWVHCSEPHLSHLINCRHSTQSCSM